MRKISGNKLLVKAFERRRVDVLFGYPGACTIDISDELYKQDFTKVILPRQEIALVHESRCLCPFYRKGGSLFGNQRARSYESGDRTCDGVL